jgi:hypothetical protein
VAVSVAAEAGEQPKAAWGTVVMCSLPYRGQTSLKARAEQAD